MLVEKLSSISSKLSVMEHDVTGQELISILESKLETRVPYSILYDLLKNNIIKTEKGSKDISRYVFSVVKGNVSDLSMLEKALGEYIYISAGITDKLVWTYPKGMDFDKLIDFENLYPAICSLISNSSKSISIINPFFDSGGVDKIGPYLRSALAKGVKIRIITGRQNTDLGNEKDDSLHDMLTFLGGVTARNIEVRHFYGVQGKLTYSVHAKLMLFDSQKAYLGSANFTVRSLSANIEIGAVISDVKVKSLEEAFELIWKHSKE
jgi:putative cardiolipin synthase